VGFPWRRTAQLDAQVTDAEMRSLHSHDGADVERGEQARFPLDHDVEGAVADRREHHSDHVAGGGDQVAGLSEDGQHVGGLQAAQLLAHRATDGSGGRPPEP